MARFFIDTSEGGFLARDNQGCELPEIAVARLVALDVLPYLAWDDRSAGERPICTVTVRDESNQVVYTAATVGPR